MSSLNKIIISLTFILLFSSIVLASQISWQAVILNADGTNIDSGDWRINLTDTTTNITIFNQQFTNAISVLPSGKSGVDEILTINNLQYERNYTACFYAATPTVTEELIGCEDFIPSAGIINPSSINLSLLSHANITGQVNTSIVNKTEGTHFLNQILTNILDYLQNNIISINNTLININNTQISLNQSVTTLQSNITELDLRTNVSTLHGNVSSLLGNLSDAKTAIITNNLSDGGDINGTVYHTGLYQQNGGCAENGISLYNGSGCFARSIIVGSNFTVGVNLTTNTTIIGKYGAQLGGFTNQWLVINENAIISRLNKEVEIQDDVNVTGNLQATQLYFGTNVVCHAGNNCGYVITESNPTNATIQITEGQVTDLINSLTGLKNNISTVNNTFIANDSIISQRIDALGVSPSDAAANITLLRTAITNAILNISTLNQTLITNDSILAQRIDNIITGGTAADATHNITTLNQSLFWNQTSTALYPRDLDRNMSIRTTIASDTLDVAGGIRVTSNMVFSTTLPGRLYKGASTGLTLHGVTGTGSDFGLYTPAGVALVENPTGSNNVHLVRGTGRVLVGDGVPAELLHVNKSQNSDTVILLENDNAGSGAFASVNLQNNPTISDSARLGITGTGFTTNGGYVQDAVFLSSEANINGGISIIARSTAAPIRFYTGGYNTFRMIIDSVGRVGIGDANPGYNLTVRGKVNISSDLNVSGNTYHDGNVSIGNYYQFYNSTDDSWNLVHT